MYILEVMDEDTDDSERSGEDVIEWNYEELSPALREQMKHHEPIVVIENEVHIPKTEPSEEPE